MAFSEAEQTQIRRWLGFSDLNRQVDLRLEAAMVALIDSGEAFGRALLADLERIECLLRDAQGTLKVLEVDGVILAHDRGVIALRREGNRYVMQLSDLLNTRPKRMAFGSAGGSGRLRNG